MSRNYRLYFLDRDGRFCGVVEIECDDDVEAIAAADRQRQGQATELWERARKVQVWRSAA